MAALLLPQEVLNISLSSRCIEEIVSEGLCRSSPGARRAGGQGQGQDRQGTTGGRRGLVGHCGKGGAAQSSPHPKGTSELCSCGKAVIRRNVVPPRTVLHCDKTRGAHMYGVHTGTCEFEMTCFTPSAHSPSKSSVHSPTLITPIHFSTAPHLLQQGWVVACPCHPLFPGRSALKIHLCSSTSKERL